MTEEPPPNHSLPGPPRPPDGSSEISEIVVSIQSATARPGEGVGQLVVTLQTNHGDLEAVLHPCPGKTGCVVFIGETGAEGVYRRLAENLVEAGVTSMRLRPRVPGEFADGVVDVLAACSFLKGVGGESAVIVGHSYAGAVAIRSGVISPFACAVAALAPQRYGTQGVESLGKPLLLIHGSDDQVLLPLASDDIYQRARGVKEMVIIEGAGHSFRGEGERLYTLLRDFITRYAGDVSGER